jgi:16S rRNA processing protein RimM
MARDDHILLGTIAKTHGVRGELILRTADPAIEPEEHWESLFLRIDGIPVPFFIDSLQPFRAGEWVLKLDWYDSRDRAESLLGYTVWVPSAWIGEVGGGFSPDELAGFAFRDRNSGKGGTILSFLDIPGNPVFEVDTGGDRILVPAREEFIVEADPDRRLVIFDFPGGLL